MKKKDEDIKKVSINNYNESDFEKIKIENGEYKTILNKMFKMRKPYTPVNSKLILSFMPGTINEVCVKAGDVIKAGDTLLVLEAMKMKNLIVSKIDGTVKKVYAEKGVIVANKQLLVEIE